MSASSPSPLRDPEPEPKRPSLAADGATGEWQVICLCADWCGTCREWRSQLAQEAERMPSVQFFWVDVEDQAGALGDLDIETFPTLLIAQGAQARFLGPVLPNAPAIGRLIASLKGDPRAGTHAPEANALLERLRRVGPGPV